MSPVRLRLLSYNIQIATQHAHYAHYLTRAWRHALPGDDMHPTLDRIAQVARGFDFVAVQEADRGSLRTRSINQIEYLAHAAGFPHWGDTVTRNWGPLAQHSHGFLSRFRPQRIEDYALPTPIPGRRALRVTLGDDAGGLTLLVTHLSLGRRSQERQLEFLCTLVSPGVPTVLMGDLNCDCTALHDHAGLRRAGLRAADTCPPTFPSWRPTRDIDHILASPQVALRDVRALPHPLSDHLPLAADVEVAGAPHDAR
ncbi:MAG TPA: endonuclease/exonuclease/phosphatase family protein [Candidatus Binatia bacterium]|nr:endonuclease/exonuclease/phosphatase family protein [Candidatus Binatia bacterium]